MCIIISINYKQLAYCSVLYYVMGVLLQQSINLVRTPGQLICYTLWCGRLFCKHVSYRWDNVELYSEMSYCDSRGNNRHLVMTNHNLSNQLICSNFRNYNGKINKGLRENCRNCMKTERISFILGLPNFNFCIHYYKWKPLISNTSL